MAGAGVTGGASVSRPSAAPVTAAEVVVEVVGVVVVGVVGVEVVRTGAAGAIGTVSEWSVGSVVGIRSARAGSSTPLGGRVPRAVSGWSRTTAWVAMTLSTVPR